MGCLLLRNREFVSRLAKLRNNKKQLIKLIKISKPAEINSLSELALNILNGNVPCSNNRKRILKKHLQSLRLVGDRKFPNKSKKKLLMKGNGFFLSTLIPIAISTIAGLLKR